MAGPQSLPLRLVPRPLLTAPRLPDTVAGQVKTLTNLIQFLQTHLNDIQQSLVGQNGQDAGGIVQAMDTPARRNSYESMAAIAPHVGDLESQPSVVSFDGPLNFGVATLPQGVNPTYVYARWAGWLIVPTAGTYGFRMQSTDGSNLFVNRVQIVGALTSPGPIDMSGATVLGAGPVPIVVEWQWGGTNTPALAVSWTPPGGAPGLIPNTVLSRSINLPATQFIVGYWFNGSTAGWHP